MANGLSMDRLTHRVAAVTSVRPKRRRRRLPGYPQRRHDPGPLRFIEGGSHAHRFYHHRRPRIHRPGVPRRGRAAAPPLTAATPGLRGAARRPARAHPRAGTPVLARPYPREDKCQVRTRSGPTAVAIGTSFVLTPTSAWAATTEDCAARPASAASRCRWLPSASRAPRTVLPSSRTGISSARSSWSAPAPAALPWPAGPASRLLISQLPTVASSTSASASVTTRQIVAFDGGRAGPAPARRYRSASTGGGTSLTQPAIAV